MAGGVKRMNAKMSAVIVIVALASLAVHIADKAFAPDAGMALRALGGLSIVGLILNARDVLPLIWRSGR